MAFLEQLERTAQDGRLSRDLRFPVAGWRVTNRVGRMKRSYVARVRPTATQVPVYPTRPTERPVYPPVTPSASPDGTRPTGRVPPGGTSTASQPPDWDGLQPSVRITDAPARGRTSPLPSPPGRIRERSQLHVAHLISSHLI